MSVVVPLLNDVQSIGECLRRIRGQRCDVADIVEVVVVDGGSIDGSRQVVTKLAASDSRLRLIENPERYAPSALNRGIAETSGDVIVRVDSHTEIAEDYVDAAVGVLQETGADVVGGPMIPVGRNDFGRAVAWALSSRWGIGGSRFHRAEAEGETDGVYMGVFRRDTFLRFGAFNPRFLRNQDDEFTYRVCERGGRVWLSPSIRSTYTPRDTPKALFLQFKGYGRYKPLVLLAHPLGARLRHLFPPATTLAWAIAPAALKWQRRALLPAVAHATALATAAVSGRGGSAPDRFVALLAMHLGYGVGFLQGVAAVVNGERPGRPPDVFAAEATSRGAPTAGAGPRDAGREAAPAPHARGVRDSP